MDPAALFKLSYGMVILTAKDGDKDNGCIINTAIQITAVPVRLAMAVNKANLTNEMIRKTGEFNLSVLTEHAPFGVFEHFGFRSGKDVDKFAECSDGARSANGIRYVPTHTSGMISGKVTATHDYGTHTLFIADVTEAFPLSDAPAMTYQYYFDRVKPMPQKPQAQGRKGYACAVCGYVYEGDSLPADFECPLCLHGAADFQPL